MTYAKAQLREENLIMDDVSQPCPDCGEHSKANDLLQKENERLLDIVKQYENSITTHRKLMIAQIEKLAELRA